ncbi:substrate-binding periplasmic protein [Alteromonas mediterranea]|uniref:substrate-binding periplasmic protein n=1 Tax=Alteromonas mediterranea TaxID=314275 RepID=UPI000A820974|nr:transporter substrate-binding domain-containing protein [Alteromonas mediterranea]
MALELNMAMLRYFEPKHSFRHILMFGIMAIWASVFSPHALASSECKAFRTAGAQQWFPYAFNEFEGRLKATGIAFDVLTLLSQDLGVTLEIETGLPWKRIESKLDTGDLDILAGNYWNEERSQKWLITAPFAAEEVYMVLSPSLVQIRGTELSLNALAQYIGVIPRGISLGEKFDSIKPNLNIVEVKDHDKMYEMIRRHRADYAISPQSAALSHLKAPENDGMQISQSPITTNNVHFAISAKSKCASLFPEFNNALSARLKDGSIEQIIDTYNLPR